MKKKTIEKTTSKLNPLIAGESAYLGFEDDKALLRQLYGLS